MITPPLSTKFLNLVTLRLLNNSIFFTKRSYTSALFIPGGKAFKTFSYLTPYLDYDKRFAQIEKLQENLKLRGFDVDATELKSSWDFYRDIDRKRLKIESKRDAVAHRMNKLMKLKGTNPEVEKELSGLSTQAKVLKHDVRAVKEILWELEESVIPQILKLPNDLDNSTPAESEIVLKIVGSQSKQNSTKSHLEIGKNLGVLDYLNQVHFYLCNQAALFEIAVQAYASKLLNDEGIFRVAGTDFAKSLLVEAAGLDHEDPFASFILKDSGETNSADSSSNLHLIGGASLISFLAMHTKQLINPKHFPLRYYATGRSYLPSVEQEIELGLFGACQTSAIHCMSMVHEVDSPEYRTEFEKLFNAVSMLYDGFERHYRIVQRPATQLEPAECSRVAFEMWSGYYQEYVEVGHISTYGDFLSKRLLIAYQTPTGRGYPAIISGTILNVNRLLGCLLEENTEEFIVPQCVKGFMPFGDI